jgi:hypothetical protein
MRSHVARGPAGQRRAPEHASRGRTRVGFCSLRGRLSATLSAYAPRRGSRESRGPGVAEPVDSGVTRGAETTAEA